jgi:ribosome-associated protein
MTSKLKAQRICQAAEDAKAEQIELIDVRQKTPVCDYLVVCGGTSDRHVESIAEKVTEKLRAGRVRALRTEGKHTGWVLLDFGDVVLHVMREEQRQFYDLEELWKSRQPDPNLLT